jgi:methionine-rich copper-binding protein CopC
LESGATWQYSTNGGSLWTTGTGNNFTISGDGAKSVTVRQTDAAGNVGAASTALAFTLDKTIATPTVALTSDTGTNTGDKLTSNAALSLSTAASDVTRSFKVDGGAASASYTAPSADGSHTVEVTDTDTAGNTTSASLTFTLDKTIVTPTAALTSDTGTNITDKLTSNAALSLSTAASDVTRSFTVDGGAASANYTAPTSNSSHTVLVTDTDTAGNTATASLTFTLDSAAPTLSSASPTDNSTAVALGSNIFLTFNESVAFGTGNIVISNGTDTRTISVADTSQVTLSGTQVTINPTADLLAGSSYNVQMASGVIKDLAGNAFAGIADATTLNFGTAGPSGGTGQTLDVMAYTWKNHTLLSGVTVAVGSTTKVTGADGSASLTGITDTNVAMQASRAVPSGEAAQTDSAVNLQDAIAILKMIVGLDVNGAGKALSPYQALAADYDGNGAVQLTDAIGVLKHVVGLTAPQPAWHFANEADVLVPLKANLTPGTAPAISVAVGAGSSPVHVGLVGYLSGDVDGSFAGAAGALDLDTLQGTYFNNLTSSHGLNLSQFGVYSV